MECKVSYGRIHYKIIGEGKPLVILHSMGTDHRAMQAWLEPLFNEVPLKCSNISCSGMNVSEGSDSHYRRIFR